MSSFIDGSLSALDNSGVWILLAFLLFEGSADEDSSEELSSLDDPV